MKWARRLAILMREMMEPPGGSQTLWNRGEMATCVLGERFVFALVSFVKELCARPTGEATHRRRVGLAGLMYPVPTSFTRLPSQTNRF